LPWAAHPVTLVYRQRRVICRRCGIRTERIEFADTKARVTRRLRQQIGVDCQSMPTSHAAVRHGVSWGKARRAEKAFLADWDCTRPKKRPRHLGLDEIQRGKGQQFWTVLSDVVHGELLLRRWKTVRGSKRAELQALFAANRHLFKAYVLREQLDRLWTYKTRPGVLDFLLGWIKALRWQRLPEMERLGDFLFKHIQGIAAYCDHPVRFGVVESINTTIKAVLRRARGMRDEAMLVPKLKWATAHPIRSARDLMRFLTAQSLYSNR
jgi:transposase